MDRLAGLDLFIRVVETGSFRKAADDLGIAQPTATKAVMSVPVKGMLRSNNLSAVLVAARIGMGLAALHWYVARESVADSAVKPVLTDHVLPAQDMHAVYPSPKLVSTKVTSFIAFLQQALAGDWWQQAP